MKSAAFQPTATHWPTARARVPAAICIALGACASCAPEPLQFADWIIEVPEGTPVREYGPVSSDDRDPDAIRLIEVLVIGADVSNPDAGLFRPSHMVAADDGTIFIADAAAKRVQMFDSGGTYLKTLGREGQGPGEFASLSGMTIAGDLLVIDDRSNNRFSTWTMHGEHVRDHGKETNVARRSRSVQGLADGTLIGSASEWNGDVETGFVAHFSLEGEELARLDEVVEAPPVIPDATWTPRDIGQAIIGLFDDPTRATVVGARQIIYLTAVHEYQVLAMSPEGTLLWALRVAGPRPAISVHLKERVVWQATGKDGGLKPDDLDWPSGYRAIARLLTDATGRLYLMPNVHFADKPPARVPVDVYSTDGERLAAGFLPARWPKLGNFLAPWTFAVGEHVYGLREDAAGETVAIRYRLIVEERRCR